MPNPSDSDLRLADRMAQSWANFAHTGNPNVEGLPEWHPYSRGNGECYMFGPEIEVRHNFDRELEEIINRHCFQKLDAFRATGSLR